MGGTVSHQPGSPSQHQQQLRRRRSQGDATSDDLKRQHVNGSFRNFLATGGDGGAVADLAPPVRQRTWRDKDTLMPENILVWGGMELSADLDERERRTQAHLQRKAKRKEARKLLEQLASSSFDRTPSLPAMSPPPKVAAAITADMDRYMDPRQWRLQHKRPARASNKHAEGGWNTKTLHDGMTILRTLSQGDAAAGAGPNASRRNFSEVPRCGDWGPEPPSLVVPAPESSSAPDRRRRRSGSGPKSPSGSRSIVGTVILGGTSHVRVMTPIAAVSHKSKHRRRRTTSP